MNASLITFVVTTIIFAACVIAVAVFISRLKKKASEIASKAFGTPDLMQGFKKMQDDYEASPKSIAAMTSVMLPRITADFPDFNYDEMKDKAENLLISYLRAITERSAGVLNSCGADLREKLETYLNMLNDKGVREHFDLIKIHGTEISSYRKSNGKCIITFQSSLESRHYTTDVSGNVTSGSKDRREQSRYNVDMIYVQDRNLVENEREEALGITCPNCGAPVRGLGKKFCEYCGAGIVELNIHAWVFSDVKEA